MSTKLPFAGCWKVAVQQFFKKSNTKMVCGPKMHANTKPVENQSEHFFYNYLNLVNLSFGLDNENVLNLS